MDSSQPQPRGAPAGTLPEDPLPGSLPEDPRLAEVARQLAQTGWGAELYDAGWRVVWVSDELKDVIGEHCEEKLGYGRHVLEAQQSDVWRRSVTEQTRPWHAERIAHYMHDTPGGKQAIEEMAPPELSELLDGLEPAAPPATWSYELELAQSGSGPPLRIAGVAARLSDADGEFIGTMTVYGPALSPSIVSMLVRGDEQMFERMARLVEPGRRQAAVLFADLEASAALSRRLPSAAYFNLVRELTTAIDELVLAGKGIVGKHAGDGVTAFFLADELGSASTAARSAIEAARGIAAAAVTAAQSADGGAGLIADGDCPVNVAINWGPALYMGQVVTGGRLEVTALGDEVNECARIQQSASGGEVLASKGLVEQLADEDAQTLSIDADAIPYETVAQLAGATEKALRDAGGIAVTRL